MRSLTGLLVMMLVGCEAKDDDEDDDWGDDTGSAFDTDFYVEPTATLDRIDLVASPSARDLGRWACHNLDVDFDAIIDVIPGLDLDAMRDEYCPNRINETKLGFSFILVFDLVNHDGSLPVSLTEIHLATALYEDQNLGAVCVSFCEPDDDDCTPMMNAEDACDLESAVAVNDPIEPADLTPTVDDLLQLAEQVAVGDSDNGESRVIPAAETIEAHIQFDIDIDTMLELSADHLTAIVEDLLTGNPTSMSVPYTMKGNLFLRMPTVGVYATGFGPFEATWDL